MTKNKLHPLYTAMYEKWLLGNHSFAGEKAIKENGVTYLPPTSGQLADGQGFAGKVGDKAYNAYKLRAIYPDIFKEAVEAAVGLMHKESPTIELPPELESMRDNATLLGESLEMVLRKIHARQLITGRLGLMGDIRTDDGKVRPIVVMYNESSILNWDDTSLVDDDVDVRMVMLDESAYVMASDFTWQYVKQYRLLTLCDEEGLYCPAGKTYGVAEISDDDEIAGTVFDKPNLAGKTSPTIPFVFVNAADLSLTPDEPPLDGLARLCLAIYRGEADYRQNLFMQGQDTLVRVGIVGESEPVRTGAGACIDVPLNGDAKYIGVSSNGLPEQRQALAADYARAYQKSGQLMDATSRVKESGDALRIRVAAQTATLPQIAKTGAAGLERVLKKLAIWYGADPDKVRVTPNLRFSDADINGKTLVELIQAKSLGAPLSEESIHEFLRTQGATKLSYEDELAKIETEQPY